MRGSFFAGLAPCTPGRRFDCFPRGPRDLRLAPALGRRPVAERGRRATARLQLPRWCWALHDLHHDHARNSSELILKASRDELKHRLVIKARPIPFPLAMLVQPLKEVDDILVGYLRQCRLRIDGRNWRWRWRWHGCS